MVHLPLHAVGILDPELVLIGVATVHAQLLAHGELRLLDAGEMSHDHRGGLDLDPQVVDRARRGAPAYRQRQIDRRQVGEELHVPGLLLHRARAEERLVEGPALREVGHVEMDVDFGGHGGLLSSTW